LKYKKTEFVSQLEIQCNAMGIMEAAPRPLFPIRSKKYDTQNWLKLSKEIVSHFGFKWLNSVKMNAYLHYTVKKMGHYSILVFLDKLQNNVVLDLPPRLECVGTPHGKLNVDCSAIHSY